MKNDGQRDAKNALLNILVFPGLGSLRSGRRLAGLGQILMVVAGSALVLVWFFQEVSRYYGLMFGEIESQPIGWIGEAGGGLFLISWLWAGVTSFSLFRAASTSDPAPPVIPTASFMKPIDATIQNALATVPQWKRTGQIITRTYAFKDFPEAMKFVNAVAALAEQAQHHPDIDVRWNLVILSLTTHDAGGLTEKDFALARECDAQAGAA